MFHFQWGVTMGEGRKFRKEEACPCRWIRWRVERMKLPQRRTDVLTTHAVSRWLSMSYRADIAGDMAAGSTWIARAMEQSAQ
jgi:hypothetical protein